MVKAQFDNLGKWEAGLLKKTEISSQKCGLMVPKWCSFWLTINHIIYYIYLLSLYLQMNDVVNVSMSVYHVLDIMR